MLFPSSGDRHPEEISVLAVDRDLTFTAYRNVVQAFTRGKQVCSALIEN